MSVTAESFGLAVKANGQRGFSLMEVLIAMLVLAVGLLGLAALQAQGLRFNNDAMVHTQANVLAQDIIDRIRLNRTNASNYAAVDIDAAIATIQSATPALGTAGYVSQCSATAITVANDVNCWLEDLLMVMPAADATIATNGTDANYLDVALMWADRDPREFADGVRLPATAAECTTSSTGITLANRTWDATNSICLVTQSWSIFP